MSELIDALKNKKRIKKFVVLTFDDGFRNVIENAYPIMRELNAKGCLYLVTSLIGESNLLWTDYVETVIRNSEKGNFHFSFSGKSISYPLDTKESYEQAMQDIKDRLRTIPDKERKEHLQQFAHRKMDTIPKEFQFSSWEQIKGLDKGILEVGSHTVTHPNCANLTSEVELENEIKNSRLAIEHKVGYTIAHFCYPAGSYNDGVIKNVRKYQYASATTIHPGFNDATTDLYQLKRIFVGEDLLLFKASISGSYFFISKIIKMLKGNK
jgi:peptidoglycan/xylan/chitin deacetylase (PgdA/CDA1 family)